MTHPDSGVLAEFRAGLITGRRGARLAAHLAACDACARVGDQLAAVTALLAAAPAPAIPDPVAQRLDTVLAAESARRQEARRADDGSPGRAPDARPSRRRGLRPLTVRVLAPAAAVAAALAAAGYGLSQIGGPASSVATASGAAAPAASRALAAPAQRKAGAVPVHGSEGGGLVSNPAAESPPYPVVTSRTYYQRATFARQVERELLSPPGPDQSPSAQIKGCVARVTDSSSLGVPVLVENAHYQGQPAIVIVTSDDGSDTAWVTRPACSASGDTVLYTQSGISAP